MWNVWNYTQIKTVWFNIKRKLIIAKTKTFRMKMHDLINTTKDMHSYFEVFLWLLISGLSCSEITGA